MSNLRELDEALKYARGLKGISFNHTGVEFDDDDRDALLTLAAEVERLRADNERLNKENDDWHKASQQLREEAQTARLALDVAQKEVERLQMIIRELGEMQEKAAARDLRFIEWVRLRQEWIAQVHLAYVDGGDLFKAVDELITFDLANPPPGATE